MPQRDKYRLSYLANVASVNKRLKSSLTVQEIERHAKLLLPLSCAMRSQQVPRSLGSSRAAGSTGPEATILSPETPPPERGRRLALSADVAVCGGGGAAAVATGLPASGWRLLRVGRLWPWLQTRFHASRATIWTPWGAPMHSVQRRGIGSARLTRSPAPLQKRFLLFFNL